MGESLDCRGWACGLDERERSRAPGLPWATSFCVLIAPAKPRRKAAETGDCDLCLGAEPFNTTCALQAALEP